MRAQHEGPGQLSGEEEARLGAPLAVGVALVVGNAEVGDQLAAAVGRHGLLRAGLVALEEPEAVDVRRDRRLGCELLVA